MYNAKQKEIFLNSIKEKPYRNKAERVFEKIENIETQENQDICNINPQRYPQLLLESDAKIGKLTSLAQLWVILMDYRSFCFANRLVDLTLYAMYTRAEILDNSFDIAGYMNEEFDRYMDEKIDIRTPSRLLDIIEERLYYPSAVRNYNDNDEGKKIVVGELIKIYILLIYLGYKEDDIMRVKMSDVEVRRSQGHPSYALIKISDKIQTVEGKYIEIIETLLERRPLFIRPGVYQYLSEEYFFLYENEKEDDMERRNKKLYNTYSKDVSNAGKLLPTIEYIRYNGIIYCMCVETKGPEKLQTKGEILDLYAKKMIDAGKKRAGDYYTKRQVVSRYNKIHQFLYGNW